MDFSFSWVLLTLEQLIIILCLWHLKLELWYDLANITHHVGQEVSGFDYAFLACDLFLAEDV